MTDNMDRRIRTSPWRRRLLLGGAVAGALAIAAAGAISLGLTHTTVRAPAASLQVETVRDDVFHDLTTLRGSVVPRDEYYLDALEGGQVSQVLVRAGDWVKAGQPLLVFRNTELELNVLDREGRLVESITELQTYEKSLQDTALGNDKAAADIDFNIVRLTRAADRRAALTSRGFVPQETEDQLRDELAYYTRLKPIQALTNTREAAMGRAQRPQIQADIVSLKHNLAVTRGELDNLTVRAPVAGLLTNLVHNVGQNFNRGDRVGEIVPNTGSKITASVDEFYLGRVRAGQTASVTVSGRPIALTVERVYPQVKDGVFQVDLAFVGAAPPGLSPGQAVEGDLTLGGDTRALVLPAGAFLERSGGAWVMVVHGDVAERRVVSIGRRNFRQVEILGGLKPGDRVIVSDYTGFEKTDRLQITR
jgi:HlyD family secretion protein